MSGLLEGRRGLVIAIVMVGVAAVALGMSADSDTVWGVTGSSTPTSAPAKLVNAVATSVVDAQTIEVASGETVRLIGVETPSASDCYGREALGRTRQLLPPGTPIRLQSDQQPTDGDGHTLAYVYRQKDGLFVNLALAKDGFARESVEPPNLSHVTELVTAVAEAEANRKGLWGKCGETTTAVPAATAPGGLGGPTTTARAAGGTVRPASATSAGGATAATTEACHPSYAGVCLPVNARSLKCSDIGGGPFGVVGPDVYNLDPDHNGIACESNK